MTEFKTRTIFVHDNLPLMRRMNSGTVDLLYMDPPFNSNMAYHRPLDGALAFEDIWPDNGSCRLLLEDLRIHRPQLHALIESMSGRGGHPSRGFLAMMAPVLIEAWRLVSRRGNLLIHCDPAEMANLAVIMNLIADSPARSIITWRRSNSGGGKKRGLGKNADFILHWSREGAAFNPIHLDDPEAARFTETDYRGSYASGDLAKPAGKSGAERDAEGRDGNGRLRTPDGGYLYDFAGFPPPDRGWRCPMETMEDLRDLDMLIIPDDPNGRIRLKRYIMGAPPGSPIGYGPYRGPKLGNVWTDIGPEQNPSYPTQKPAALMERIVELFSDRGDMVFDPFCGSGAMLKAAARMGREWAGCDRSPVAAEELKKWTDGDVYSVMEELMSGDPGVEVTTGIPESRTDLGKAARGGRMPDSKRREMKESHKRIQAMAGIDPPRCALCRREMKDRDIQLDHIFPVSQGGPDSMENTQLMCGACNAAKGDRTMAETMDLLRRKDRVFHAEIVSNREAEGLPHV